MAGETNIGKQMEVFFDTDSNETIEVPVDQATIATTPVSDEDKNKSKKATTKDIGSGEPVVVDDVEEFIEHPKTDGDEDKNKSKKEDEDFEDLTGEDKNKDKDKGKKTPSKSKAESSSSSSPYSVLAKALHEEGVLTDYSPEEFDELVEEHGSPAAALIELHKKTIAEGIKADRANLTPLQQEYLEALANGVPHETISTLQSFAEQVGKITPEIIDADEDVAKDIIEQALQIRGFTEEEIKDQIDMASSAGRLKTNAKGALTYLQKYVEQAKKQETTKAEAARESAKQAYQDNLKAIKTKIVALSEVVPGQKLSNKVKASIYEAITVPVAINNTTGQTVNLIGKKRLENPVEFDIKLAYLIQTGFFDGNMAAINRSAKTTAITELESVINGNVSDGSSGRKPSKIGDNGKTTATETLESLNRIMKRKQGN